MFYGLFEDKSDVEREFNVNLKEAEIIFASYEYEDYSGSADVLYIQNGKIYHVWDSHCSCNGLEYWNPEEMPILALLRMLLAGDSDMAKLSDVILNSLKIVQEKGLIEMDIDQEIVMYKLTHK